MEQKNDIKAILFRLKHQRGLSMKQVADELGMNYSYLSDVNSGRSPFTDATRAKFIQVFGKHIVDPDATEPVRPKVYGGKDGETPMVLLPLIPIDCLAGLPSSDNDGISLDDCEQYAVPEFSARGAEFLVRVSGTSMQPRYNSGDLLACRRVTRMTFFQWGMVYVIDTEQGMLVKRLYEYTNDDNMVVCHSENTEEFPDFKLPKSEIRSVSIVVGHISLQ